MNNDCLEYQAGHTAWKQRLSKELGASKRYVQKSYKDGFNPNGPWMASHDLPSSFPAPYIRQNNDYRVRKFQPGFVNDSSGTNPGDPSSMVDRGHYRNSVYAVEVRDLPDGSKPSKKP